MNITRSLFAMLMCAASLPAFAVNCPAYPQFPSTGCTGWAHTGVSLTTYSGSTTITTNNTTIDSKQINSSITIAANNVTIKRSQVNGQIFISGSTRTGILIEDVKIVAPNTGGGSAGQCIGGNSGSDGGDTAADFIIRRTDISGCSQGVYGRGFTLEDSYIHDLYGQGADHNEAILGHTGQIVVRHNYLFAGFNGDSTGGGMSAVIALYTHSAFWGDMDSVTIEKNFLKTDNSGAGQAGYCLYMGGTSDDSGQATNMKFIDNIFALGSGNVCGTWGPTVYPPDSPGNASGCFTNNKYENGTAITEGTLAACAARPSKPTNFRTVLNEDLFMSWLILH
jgi:hypothetical protein